MPAIIWWIIKKLLGRPSEPPTDGYIEQIARYRRPGFKDPRQKEIERRDAGLFGWPLHQVLMIGRLPNN